MKQRIRLSENDLHRIVKESVKNVLNENDARFLPSLKKTYETLYHEYEKWQYSKYKPQGIDKAIYAIMAAMNQIQDVMSNIEPGDDIPTYEDPNLN